MGEDWTCTRCKRDVYIGRIAWDFGNVEVLGDVLEAVCVECLQDIHSEFQEHVQKLREIEEAALKCSRT